MRTLFLLPLLFISLASCHQQGALVDDSVIKKTSVNDFFKSKDYVAIPLIRNSIGHFTVKVKVNADTAELILDTGASETCLDKGSAKKLGVHLESVEGQASGYGGESEDVKTGKVSLTLNQLVIPSFPITVIDLSYVNKAYLADGNGRIDGVLGVDILRKHQAVIDYGTNTLFLHR